MITIENEYIKVGILEYGAELCSYIDKQNKREVIWNGDSKYWKRYSPILFPLVGNTINLKEDLFKDDALIFDDLKSKSLIIESNKGGDKVKVGWNNFPDMGIWKSYNNSTFICIEPWNGMADQVGLNNDFKNKKGVVKLSGESEFECLFTIENLIQ